MAQGAKVGVRIGVGGRPPADLCRIRTRSGRMAQARRGAGGKQALRQGSSKPGAPQPVLPEAGLVGTSRDDSGRASRQETCGPGPADSDPTGPTRRRTAGRAVCEPGSWARSTGLRLSRRTVGGYPGPGRRGPVPEGEGIGAGNRPAAGGK